MRGDGARRFGLITTNSITQFYNRKLVERHLSERDPATLLFAIPDHPWVDSADGTAVRVSLTVATSGTGDGILAEVTGETAAAEGVVEVALDRRGGKINPDLTIGVSVAKAQPLLSNRYVCRQGVKLVGAGFVVDQHNQTRLGEDRKLLKNLLCNRDLMQKHRKKIVLDATGFSEEELRSRYSRAYQYLYDHVREMRLKNRDQQRSTRWWLFGRTNEEMRAALSGLRRFIVTPEVASHRCFTFANRDVLPDASLYVIESDDAYVLGVLSNRLHVVWALAIKARLGFGNDPRYQNGPCFDPFPFPVCDDALKARIRALGEELDAHRKRQQVANTGLTLTGMYNVLEKLRKDEPLTEKERVIHEQGLVSLLKEIHDRLDAAVLEAYGWEARPDDEAILERLVELNRERAEEERRGLVRWLRPEFQVPRAGLKPVQEEMAVEAAVQAVAAVTASVWPKALPEQVRAVEVALAAVGGAATPAVLAKGFKNARRERVDELLQTLVAMGRARAVGEGRYAA